MSHETPPLRYLRISKRTEIQMESSGSSASLREQLPVIQSISASAGTSVDTLVNFQQKVDETLKYEEETISLRSQLKIAQETNDLQAAEFAFQKDELTNELASLKQANADLLKKLESQTEASSKAYSYDVKVKIEAEMAKAAAAERCAQKLKERVAELEKQLATEQSENSRSKAKLDDLTKQTDEQASQIQKLVTKLQKERKKAATIQQQAEENAKTTETFANENSSMKSKIANLQVYIRDLEEKNAGMSEELAKLSDISQDYAKTAQALSSLTKKMKRLETAKLDCEAAMARLQEMEAGRNVIMSALEVIPTTEEEDEWQLMEHKARQLVETAARVVDVERENEKLRSRLNVAAEEIRRKQNRAPSDIRNKDDDVLISSLQAALRESQEELTAATSSVRNLRLRLKFAQRIDESQRSVVRGVSDLHTMVTKQCPSDFRSVILCVVFAKRLVNRDITETDPTSLRFFAGRLNTSLDRKVFEIRQVFNQLEHDLAMEKHSREEAVHRAEICAEESKETRSKHQREMDNCEIDRERMQQLEEQNKYLQEQLDMYFSPDEYANIKAKLGRNRKKNKMCVEQIKHLFTCVEENTHKYETLRQKYKEAVVEANAKVGIANDYKAKYEKAKGELATFEKLVEEKNREILSLERYVQRLGTRHSVCLQNLGAFAIENHNMDQHIRGETNPSRFIDKTVVRTLSGHGLITASNCINPAFLGDTCY